MHPFKDHFSGHAGDYRAFRPSYPEGLADLLAGASPATELAWDAGCGNGQLSTMLAGRFAAVHATDASAEQIARAEPHPRVRYAAASAEDSGLPDGCCDLVVAAQAAHWFDLARFYAEVRRVARPGAAAALVCYGLQQLGEPALDAAVERFHNGTIGPYWPADRWKVVDGYRGLDFPFPALPVPPLAMEAVWPLPRLLGYMSTWSGVKAATEALGRNPLEAFAAEIAPLWGAPERERTIRWPLTVRLGRVG
ncbi:class I SAM-dependent methyltransferase [Azospirillum picis]|uniref:SAM-dependent methyltransferase n=1 Tax=Azospirillum picis TaxID=488438 RepID=A0ABU0MPS1_9PROT|nr:class I SAM-dependent methyltransferase [Azospirillum picis]MBP2301706.1 SAM-dependent methyltransferase [Azospirillum picis]MDQ0535470.1 SAM-dependent methyltransferase [Azospirillum picis]